MASRPASDRVDGRSRRRGCGRSRSGTDSWSPATLRGDCRDQNPVPVRRGGSDATSPARRHSSATRAGRAWRALPLPMLGYAAATPAIARPTTAAPSRGSAYRPVMAPRTRAHRWLCRIAHPPETPAATGRGTALPVGWADLIRRGQQDGSIREDLDATASAVVLFGLMRGVAALLLTESEITDMGSVRSTCDAWIVSALAPPVANQSPPRPVPELGDVRPSIARRS